MSYLMEKFVYLGTAGTDEDIYGHFLMAVRQARKFHGEGTLLMHTTPEIFAILGSADLDRIEVRVTPSANKRADLYCGKFIVATVQDWRPHG
jgi:hypothetical protein